MSAPRGSAASKQLSQTDIDQMMRGGVPAEQPAERASAQRSSPDVQIYDFQRPHRVSRERLRTLEAMYGRLVKSFEGWLIGRVRGVVDLRLNSVEQISFGEYVLSLPASCNSFLLDIKDRAGDNAVGEQAVIDIGRELAYFLVDRLFGGGSETTILDRALTPIERLAVRVVAERIMALVQEVWGITWSWSSDCRASSPFQKSYRPRRVKRRCSSRAFTRSSGRRRASSRSVSRFQCSRSSSR